MPAVLLDQESAAVQTLIHSHSGDRSGAYLDELLDGYK